MRSLLFVPANEKMLGKIPSFSADAYIVDLEDSISPGKKEDALKNVIEFLKYHRKNIFVRLDSALIANQVSALSGCDFDGYMLPKFEAPENFAHFIDEFSRRKIIALIETPAGLVNVRETASCSWVDGLAFGAEDYTSCTGMKNSHELLYAHKSRLVMFAKAFRKLVFDTPCFVLNDDEKFFAEVQASVDMGFNGKLAVHPKQIETINKLFLRESDRDFMRSIIARYEASGEAVISVDGKIYEKMHIAEFKRILGEQDK